MGEFEVASSQRDSPQHASEYARDIFRLLKTKEASSQVSPSYMERQVHVNAKMRAILVDWLVDVGKKYKLRAETLFLAVQLIDRYLEINATQRRHLQLVGATALLIAAKFEEVYPPQIKEFEYITDKAYSRDEILKMEICILKALDFNICCPTAISFLDRYHVANGSSGCTESHRCLAQYLLELSLVEYKMVKYGPSHLAAASLLLSNKLLRQVTWPASMVQQTQISERMLQDCAKDMCGLLENVETSSLQAVRKKFSQPSYHSIAKLNFWAGSQTSMVSARRSSIGGA
jgi:cyclin B